MCCAANAHVPIDGISSSCWESTLFLRFIIIKKKIAKLKVFNKLLLEWFYKINIDDISINVKLVIH